MLALQAAACMRHDQQSRITANGAVQHCAAAEVKAVPGMRKM